MDDKKFVYHCPACNRYFTSTVDLGWGSHPCDPCMNRMDRERKAEREAKTAKKQKSKALPDAGHE